MVSPPHVELDVNGLRIVESGGEGNLDVVLGYFNYLWLRDNCPTSWSPETRDRVFDILGQPADAKPTTATIADRTLVIVWSQDGHISRYDLDWLLRWQALPGHEDPANVLRNLWDCGHLHSLGRYNFAQLIADRRTQGEYLEVLLRDGIAMVYALPDRDGAITELAEIAGIVRATFSGAFFNVKAEPDPMGIAYTANALEPHTDSPCEDYPPGVQYLHCRLNSTVGGESVFVDGAAIAEELRRRHPSDFALLATYSVPFRFGVPLFLLPQLPVENAETYRACFGKALIWRDFLAPETRVIFPFEIKHCFSNFRGQKLATAAIFLGKFRWF